MPRNVPMTIEDLQQSYEEAFVDGQQDLVGVLKIEIVDINNTDYQGMGAPTAFCNGYHTACRDVARRLSEFIKSYDNS